MARLAMFEVIEEDLQRVEIELQRMVKASVPLVTDASSHLLVAGGKRMRPAFALLSAKLHIESLETLISLATALELIHMATLVHDDVVDNSFVRRGLPTVKARWGDAISLYAGSFLFARSLLLISTYSDPRVAGILARVSVEMCRGEIEQLASAFNVNQGIKDYLQRIKKKTALLISASCQLGGVVSKAPKESVRVLASFGYLLGMAFQITDDVLDLVANEKELGKPVASDLRQGILTLPAIYALRKSNCDKRFQELIGKREKTEEEVNELVDLISHFEGVDYCERVAQRYLEKAKDCLKLLPVSPARSTLEEVTEFVGTRRF